MATVSANSSAACRLRPWRRSSSRPMRIISPYLKVWARPRNAIATMDQAAKSSPEGMLTPIWRPTDRPIISRKMSTRKPAAVMPEAR